MEKITVIGGGITGLATAYLAAKNGKKVQVLEGSPKVGGLLNTFEIGGNRLEHYYHHFFTHDAEINWLIKELGISDELFFKKTSMGVYRKGKLYDFNGALDLLKFKPIGLDGVMRFGLSSLFLGKKAQWRDYENVPAVDWLYKYAGKKVTNSLWKPLLDIKFGPYANQVPLAWLVGRLRQRFSSRKAGEEQLGYLKGSLQTLLDALLAKLKELNVEIITNCKITAVDIENKTLKSVKSASETYTADKFVFTIPTLYTHPLLRDKAPSLAEKLKAIEYFGAVCVIMESTKQFSPIYWMNVADENFPFGGIIEHTNFIPSSEYNGKHITYLSRYFAHSEDIASMSADEIKTLMLPFLPKIYPDFDASSIEKVHVFKTMTAATVCDLNFSQKVPSAKTEIEGLFLANMAHIYPDERSTNNSIRVAAEVCATIGMDTAEVPYGQSLSAQIGFD